MIRHAVFSFSVAAATTALLLFLPAGTIRYWQAWVFMALFFIPMAFIALYLFKCCPELLERRLYTKEKESGQGILSKLFYVSVCLVFVISCLDRRFSWSSVPLGVIVVSEAVFLAGYFFLFLVFRENKYLDHTVVVVAGQEVVATGPYSIVRHPMYLSELIMFVFAPVSLGSYWAVTSNLLLIMILVIRILTEEGLLLRELKGYREYTQKTKYRLVPGIW